MAQNKDNGNTYSAIEQNNNQIKGIFKKLIDRDIRVD